MPTSARAALPASLLFVLLAACSGPAAEDVGETGDELRTSYGDFFETLTDSDRDRWLGVRASLASGFGRICGDTICGGDYSNLRTARIACSSTFTTRKLKDCAWVLGGSIDYVDGRTGKITSEPRVFTCKIPVAGTAKTMLDALTAAGEGALQTPIPGTGKSFYDGLVDCFAGVVGGPPPAPAPKTFYVEMSDWSWEAGSEEGLAWSAGTRQLAANFANVCGDTFCGGDYSAIAPLRFACSVNVNSKRVSRCTWSFAAAELTVDARGKLVANTTTKKCNVEVGASASALTATLASADALHAALPGKTTSIYDALVGCL